MNKYFLTILAGAATILSSCSTLTSLGLNPMEERYTEKATVIQAGPVRYDSGTDSFGKGRGKAVSKFVTSGYTQEIVIRTKSGKVFNHTESSSVLGGRAIYVGQTGTAEIGKVSGKLWDFKH